MALCCHAGRMVQWIDLHAPLYGRMVGPLRVRKTPLVLKALPDAGNGRAVQYTVFARARFTEATRKEAELERAELVDLDRLDSALASAQANP